MSACNKDSILHRINEFREYSGISKSTLAATIGVEQTTFNNQLLGKRSLSLDTIISMLSTFSELSSEWLLRDRGDMFLKKYDGSLEASNLKQAERIEKLIGTIETLQESIDLRNQTIATLNERIKQLENQLNSK